MSKSTYAALGDACATAHGMELIGSRWTYPILRELMLGPKRFNELLVTVRGITPAVLTGRLRDLAASGLVERANSSTAPHLYALTPWATELGPILRDLGRWAQGSPVREPGGGLTPDAAVQAMMTMAQTELAGSGGQLQLNLRDDRASAIEYAYQVTWGPSGLHVERGAAAQPGTTVVCDSSTWADILFEGAPLDANADVTGDPATVSSLLACFPLA